METEVIMLRPFLHGQIAQKSKSEFLCATDLERVGNAWRLNNGLGLLEMSKWLMTKGVKEFIKALEEKTGEKVIISGRGRGHKTWMHPYLFLDYALAINPEFKIEVYTWLYDCLLKYRNTSGDSYKKMTGALYNNYPNKRDFTFYVIDVAKKIQNACNVDDWQKANEKQLELRDTIHDNIALLCDVISIDEAVRIGIKKAKDEVK